MTTASRSKSSSDFILFSALPIYSSASLVMGIIALSEGLVLLDVYHPGPGQVLKYWEVLG